MKKLFTNLLLIGCTYAVQAQPQLQSSMIETGTSYSLYLLANVDVDHIRSSGANATWDISTAAKTKVATISFVTAASTPYAGAYPDGNFAMKYETGTNATYSIFKLTSTGLDMLADQLGGASVNYTNSRNLLRFPLSFSDTYTDDYQKTGQQVKTLRNTYDAYGTMNTSLGMMNQVVRVLQVNGDGDTSAIWWSVSNGKMNPVLQADGNGIFSWESESPTGFSEYDQTLSCLVYPNPSNGLFTFMPATPQCTLSITDVTGKVIYTGTVLSGSTVDMRAFKPGVYFYTVTNNLNQASRGKLVNE